MMQMLAAGGVPVLSDGERTADVDNPKGYLEWERIKQLPRDPGCIAEADGKAVKVISQLLLSLPAGFQYRVVFLQRSLAEVLASQDKMLQNRGTSSAKSDHSLIAAAFEKHLTHVDSWLKKTRDLAWIRIPYHDIVREPRAVALRLTDFLAVPLDVEAMTRQVDQNLYRQRATAS